MVPARITDTEKLTNLLAEVNAGMLDFPEAAKLAGMAEHELEASLHDGLVADAEARSIGLQRSGAAVQAISLRGLLTAVTQLGERLEAGDMSAGTLRSVIETLYRVCGLAERAAAAAEPAMEAATIIINLGDRTGREERIVNETREPQIQRIERAPFTVEFNPGEGK